MPAPRTLPPLSQRVGDLRPSPIREILALTQRQGMISFAGGLPAPESLPRLCFEVPPAALQYGATEGDSPLRQRIAADLRALGLTCTEEQVLVLSGSQQGIDLVAKLFIDPGTWVAVESPTYLAALQVFRFFGARFQAYRADDSAAITAGAAQPAFAYVIPTFQNPTGHCYSTAQRVDFARHCDAGNIPVFEDDPYRDLTYDECARKPICAELKSAPWIYQGSFSKTFAPGLRLGYLVASPDLIPYLARLKQAADLHSNRLSQSLVLQQLEDPHRPEQLGQLVETYRKKRDAFAARLHEHFSDLADWETPKGGLFFWLRLKHPADTTALLQEAIAANVAFMPGEPFYPGSPPSQPHLRLNFSHASIAEAAEGLARLAGLLKQPRYCTLDASMPLH